MPPCHMQAHMSFLFRTTWPLPCAALLRRLCAAHHLHKRPAAVCSLQSRHPCSCTSARKLSGYRKRHFAGAVNVHHRQSVLLRVHKSSLSQLLAVTTAHRVCGLLTSPLALNCRDTNDESQPWAWVRRAQPSASSPQ